MSVYYHEGWDAFLYGYEAKDCPYDIICHEYDDWIDGWYDAKLYS